VTTVVISGLFLYGVRCFYVQITSLDVQVAAQPMTSRRGKGALAVRYDFIGSSTNVVWFQELDLIPVFLVIHLSITKMVFKKKLFILFRGFKLQLRLSCKYFVIFSSVDKTAITIVM
jgi:hypothetical protein